LLDFFLSIFLGYGPKAPQFFLVHSAMRLSASLQFAFDLKRKPSHYLAQINLRRRPPQRVRPRHSIRSSIRSRSTSQYLSDDRRSLSGFSAWSSSSTDSGHNPVERSLDFGRLPLDFDIRERVRLGRRALINSPSEELNTTTGRAVVRNRRNILQAVCVILRAVDSRS
jgi:hypothetical protein